MTNNNGGASVTTSAQPTQLGRPSRLFAPAPETSQFIILSFSNFETRHTMALKYLYISFVGRSYLYRATIIGSLHASAPNAMSPHVNTVIVQPSAYRECSRGSDVRPTWPISCTSMQYPVPTISSRALSNNLNAVPVLSRFHYARAGGGRRETHGLTDFEITGPLGGRTFAADIQ